MRTRTHGLDGTYKAGCRCVLCTEIHRQTAAANRLRDPDVDRRNYRRHRERKVARVRQWRRDNPEYRRQSHLKAKYGITPEDFDRMAAEQEGRCGICERTPKQLVVDHCHDTGRVRGLLCRQCNAAIGQLKDDPNMLRRAIGWLES